MHKCNTNSNDAKDMFHLREDDLYSLWAAYDTGGFLLNQYETAKYKYSVYS